VLRTSAARLLQSRALKGASFVNDEIRRLDDERDELDRKLVDVTGRLDYLERNPANVVALTADLAKLDPIWDHLVPAEQHRIAQLLLDQVVVYPDRPAVSEVEPVEIALRADDLYSLVAELHPEEDDATAN